MCAAAVWASRSLWTAGPVWSVHLGTALLVAGIALMIVAAMTLIRARTTVIPHREPDALVDHGIYALSRNPIYLADAIILTGLALRWQAPLGLLLVPVFVWWITRHFIIAEEQRLQRGFGAAFAKYCARTRRWV
nr:isoprenylcysteine carboxylmethyltransferase family protein [Loktanella sp. SALINAS62]